MGRDARSAREALMFDVMVYHFPLYRDDPATVDELARAVRDLLEGRYPGRVEGVEVDRTEDDPALAVWFRLRYPADRPPAELQQEVLAEIADRGLTPLREPVAYRLKEREAERERPVLRFWMDPGDAPPEVVADLLRALSNLHVAAGGLGLTYSVDEDGSLVIASAEELV